MLTSGFHTLFIAADNTHSEKECQGGKTKFSLFSLQILVC